MTASTPDLRISRQPHFIRKTHQIEEQLQRDRPVLHISHRRAALVWCAIFSLPSRTTLSVRSRQSTQPARTPAVAAQLASRVQGVLGGRPGLGGVGEEALAEIGSQREGLVRQVEVADDRVVDELDAGGVDLNVVSGPSTTKLVGAGGQLANQIGEAPVVVGGGQPRRVTGRRCRWRPCSSRGRTRWRAGRGRRTGRCWVA